MSMDILLKSDEQPFVSVPVSFGSYIYIAKKTEEEQKKMAPKAKATENFRKSTRLPQNAAERFEMAVDVDDLAHQMFNREMDGGLERNQMISQTILMEENSRRRNAQYKSIAYRALRYDHLAQSSLARKSPHLVEKRPTNLKNLKETAVSNDLKVNFKEIELESDSENEVEVIELGVEECQDLTPFYKDLIVNVSIYFGYTRELEYHEIRLGRLMKVTDRLELTGDHSLFDLKNAFSCPADYAFTEDFSEKKPTIQDFAKNKYPSAMFFIHDTFYIEPQTHRPEWEDPSVNIRKWAAKREYLGPMNVASMTEKKLGDVFCRLGQPYVFIHQGVCEHLIVFNDLFMRNESHVGVDFPRKLVERNFRRIACDTCKEAFAQWMIVDHENLLPNSPGYLCSTCYKELCFDVKGKKVCQFKAVPYCDRKEVGDGGKFISELRFESKQD
ncbi:unnamed protein product [Caenorhabditis sp. 36 PRJEB53466]|nr:unnamed protein product [Caenorhabditis sp. 36 PRJEB53466]